MLCNIYKRVSSRSKKLPLISLFGIVYRCCFIIEYIDVIYPKELEIKDTTDAPKWANYLDLHLEFDEDGKPFTRLYDKRDDFDFPIFHFPYLSSNIPESPA